MKYSYQHTQSVGVAEVDIANREPRTATLGKVREPLSLRTGCPREPSSQRTGCPPSHSRFENNGLYSKSKISLETLFQRWALESWGECLCLAGAVIR